MSHATASRSTRRSTSRTRGNRNTANASTPRERPTAAERAFVAYRAGPSRPYVIALSDQFAAERFGGAA